jgi:hypothetical protein
MKYAIASVRVEDEYVWEVFEMATAQVIERFYFEDDAMEMARFYDAGGGFAGFTPSFMIRSVTLSVTNVNEEFTRVFA